MPFEKGGRGKPTTLTKNTTPYFFYEGGGREIACLKELYSSLSVILFYRKYYIFLLLIDSLALCQGGKFYLCIP
jgi:hypothetical protein